MKKTLLLPALWLAPYASLRIALVALTALAFWPPPARAAVTEAWIQRYNGPMDGWDEARAVAVDGSHNVVVTGYSGTIKYLADGTGVWTNNAGATALAVDGSANVVVTGYASNGTNSDYYTAKYAAADGALLWEKLYNGPANRDDYANSLAVDAGGNVVVTGSSYNATNSDYYTVKYASADGALLWEKRYNGPANHDDFANALALDINGNVVVAGVSDTKFAEFVWVEGDYYTAKYAAADGALLWERRYAAPAGGDDYATAVAVDGSGNVVVTGSSYYGPADDYVPSDYYTAKYAAGDGMLLWEKRYIGGGMHVMAMDGSGNVVVAGSPSQCSCGGIYAAKYAAPDGALIWEKRSDGPPYNEALAVTADRSGNVVVTGYANTNYYTAKYAAANGALLWEKRYHGSANGYNSASSLALGPNGMVAITGTSSGDYATVVYWENLPPVAIERVPTGIRLRFTGVPGRSYTIERGPAVTGPWSTLATPTAPLDGLIEYVDTNSPVGAAFYRTVQP